MPKHILLVAGDPSGDERAAELAQELRNALPEVRITALGGEHLRQTADHFAFPLVDIGGFGFWEPIFKLPALWKAKRTVQRILIDDRPDAVIPVDFYGFNSQVCVAAHAVKIPVIYYVSPQVWASRPGRVKKLARLLTRMLVIFPFEEAIYKAAGVPVTFVGHPLLDRLPEPGPDNTQTCIIGLLPGSRLGVVERHLPILIETARLIRERAPQSEFILFRPDHLTEDPYVEALKAAPWIRLVQDETYTTRRTLALAISVSGTAALENTLLGIPMIIMYRLSWLTFQIAKRLIRVPFVGIPNILAGKAVVPELLQQNATPDKLAAQALDLLQVPERLKVMRRELLSLRDTLKHGGASRRAAQEIASLIA